MSHVDLKYFGLAATVGDITLNPGDVFRVTSKGSYLTLAKKLDGKVMSADIDWKVAEELYNFSNEFKAPKLEPVTAARVKHQLTRPTPKRAREPEPKEERRERGRPAGTGGRKSKRVYKYHGEDVVVHDIHTGGRAKRVTIAKHDRIILHPLNRKNSDKYTHVRLHHGERQHIITKEEADHLIDNANREYPHSKAKEFGDKHGFQWHSYHGRSFSLASKHGKLTLRLEPGHKVGLREYLTDENKFKLLHPLHGRARLFTIDRKTAERIKRNSKASNRVTK